MNDQPTISWSQFAKVYAKTVAEFANFTAELAKEYPTPPVEAPVHSEVDKFHSFLKSGKVTRSQVELIWSKLSSDQKRELIHEPSVKPVPTKPREVPAPSKIEELSSEESEIEVSVTKRPRRLIDSEDEELIQPKKQSSLAAKFTWK